MSGRPGGRGPGPKADHRRGQRQIPRCDNSREYQ